LNLRLPECEILRSTSSVKAFIRNRDFFKLPQALETGAEHGMWSFDRYQAWMAKRPQWHVPDAADQPPDPDEILSAVEALQASPAPRSLVENPSQDPRPPAAPIRRRDGPIEIEPVEGGLDEVIKRLK